jgi:hypothetical protein
MSRGLALCVFLLLAAHAHAVYFFLPDGIFFSPELFSWMNCGLIFVNRAIFAHPFSGTPKCFIEEGLF